MEKLGFTAQEHDNMQDFFSRELKKIDAKEVLRIVNFMVKDIANAKLRKYFVNSITKYVSFL